MQIDDAWLKNAIRKLERREMRNIKLKKYKVLGRRVGFCGRSFHWRLYKAARLNAGTVLQSLPESQQEQQELVHQELAKSTQNTSIAQHKTCSLGEVLVHMAVCNCHVGKG
jgi:hypothetical protein